MALRAARDDDARHRDRLAGSRTRDRKFRPITYADLRIRWYWRIDSDAAGQYLAAYELSGGAYKLIGEFGAVGRPPRIELSVPFPVSFDLAELFPTV